MLSVFILAISSVVGSLILFSHRRLLTVLAVAAILFQVEWLLLTLIARTLASDMSSTVVFLAGSIVIATVWLAFYQRITVPYRIPGTGKRDLGILPVLVVVIAAAFAIWQYNGFQETTWVTHGFFNGDTTTFVSLVQKSLITQNLVADNPFAGNGYLEYPTVLHAGVAELLKAFSISHDWYIFLPLLTYIQIVITIPLFFLLVDTIYPSPVTPNTSWFGIHKTWAVHVLIMSVIAYVLFLSWDTYVYPQSHFFLMGMFLVIIALFAKVYSLPTKKGLVEIVIASIATVILMRANAVTGTAAVIAAVVFYGLRVVDMKRSIVERCVFLGAGIGLVGLFLVFNAGDALFSLVPQFSYTAAIDMARLALPLTAVLVTGFFLSRSQTYIATLATVLSLLAGFTFFFSSRDIVIDNASRFFYHAILVGFPLVIPFIIQGFYALRRELFYTSLSLGEVGTRWGVLVLGLFLVLLPAASSVASAHDNLMFQNEQRITAVTREAMDWVTERTSPTSIFLASPEPPWFVPLLTGRALLRTDYWLSPDDETSRIIREAFAGNTDAQQQAMRQVNYVILTREQEKQWNLPADQKVFNATIFGIYTAR